MRPGWLNEHHFRAPAFVSIDVKPSRWVVILLVGGGAIVGALLGLGIASAVQHLLFSMRLSQGKRHVGDVTAIASSLERYRAENGCLPAARPLGEIKPYFANTKYRSVIVTATSYSVTETNGGEWRVVDGRWTRYPTYIPPEWIRASEEQIRLSTRPSSSPRPSR